jgi:hypothetical protein
MTTPRKSLLAIVFGWLMRGQVPIDGMHIWEPSGAINFTPRKPLVRQNVRRKVTEKAPRVPATASSLLCPQ